MSRLQAMVAPLLRTLAGTRKRGGSCQAGHDAPSTHAARKTTRVTRRRSRRRPACRHRRRPRPRRGRRSMTAAATPVTEKVPQPGLRAALRAAQDGARVLWRRVTKAEVGQVGISRRPPQCPAYSAAPSRVGPGDCPEGDSGRLVTRTEALAVQSWKRPRGRRTRPRTAPVPVKVRCLRWKRRLSSRQKACSTTSIWASGPACALTLTTRSPSRSWPEGKTEGSTAVADLRATRRALAAGASAPSATIAHVATSATVRIRAVSFTPLISAPPSRS
jgi:hypothetical protein